MPASSVFMVRPAVCYSNPQTADSNSFQTESFAAPDISVVCEEFDRVVGLLESEGIDVHVYQDTAEPEKPDAIFPNNWLGIHKNGYRIYYPMEAINRRIENNEQVRKFLDSHIPAKKIFDFSHHEESGQFLEGTGSMIFDYLNNRVFASQSSRTHKNLFMEIASLLGFEPIWFNAHDTNGKAYYHTNVILSIGTQYALLCTEAIEPIQRQMVLDALSHPQRSIIELSRSQVAAFAGNVLELSNMHNERIIAISETALNSLNESQLAVLSRSGLLLPVSIPVIEKVGGGSIRCMLAEVY
jgi:hypothetical protein